MSDQRTRELTEDEISIIQTAAKDVASSLVYGFYTVKDIEQDAFLLVLEAIRDGSYDESKPLRPFAYKHIKNRINNKKRKELCRQIPNCEQCELLNGEACSTHKVATKLNRDKRSLLYPFPLMDTIVAYDTDTAEYRELCSLILDGLKGRVKNDYIKLIEGHEVPKDRLKVVRSNVREILHQYKYEV